MKTYENKSTQKKFEWIFTQCFYPMPLMNRINRKSQNHGAKLARPPNSPLTVRDTIKTLRRPFWSAK